MAKYKFDGTKLKDGSTTIANVKGNDIRDGSGSTTVANIKGDDIRKGNGSTTLFNVKGDDIRQGNGSTRIAKMDDVDDDIDGPGHVVKAALWLFYCR